MALPYREGTWFAVPLRQGGYASGVVARHSPEGGVILAYLFGPRTDNVPSLEQLRRAGGDDAVKVARVGDLGLIDGTWPLIGQSSDWERAAWPVPPFVRRDDLSRSAWLVRYADDDPNQVTSEERVAFDVPGMERDALLGAGAAEVALTRLLS